jgi:probable F420-dependent oxidoreductase
VGDLDDIVGAGSAGGAMELIASAPAQLSAAQIGPWAERVERMGFDTIHVSETIHDPFTVAAFALHHTSRLTVRTSMVLAFPRSPMVTAYSAWDLAKDHGGRFQLGIASQVRGNIVGRFSTPWSEPVARLADYITALRAIFTAFQTGAKLDHSGPHYRFDRLQPYFNPGPLDGPAPQIWTGGVNKGMCIMAGEFADGFVCHPTNSHPRLLAAQTLPALAQGLSRNPAGGQHSSVVANPQLLMAATPAALDALKGPRRAELAFLYSTPAYRRQLEHFGLGDIGTALSAMAQRNEWSDLHIHLTDEVCNRLVPQATYDDMPDLLAEWYSGLCTGLSMSIPIDATDDHRLAAFVERCRTIRALRPGELSGRFQPSDSSGTR